MWLLFICVDNWVEIYDDLFSSYRKLRTNDLFNSKTWSLIIYVLSKWWFYANLCKIFMLAFDWLLDLLKNKFKPLINELFVYNIHVGFFSFLTADLQRFCLAVKFKTESNPNCHSFFTTWSHNWVIVIYSHCTVPFKLGGFY